MLVRDERCSDVFEARRAGAAAQRSALTPRSQALVGTLRAAKKRKVVDYAGEMLLQGAHDGVHVVLLVDSYPPAAPAAAAAPA